MSLVSIGRCLSASHGICIAAVPATHPRQQRGDVQRLHALQVLAPTHGGLFMIMLRPSHWGRSRASDTGRGSHPRFRESGGLCGEAQPREGGGGREAHNVVSS